MAESKKHYFLVTDRKSLDRGHVTVNPIPISVKGVMEYLGDEVIQTEGKQVIKFVDTGSKVSMATLKSLARMDGIVEVTEKLVTEVYEAAVDLGIVEE